MRTVTLVAVLAGFLATACVDAPPSATPVSKVDADITLHSDSAGWRGRSYTVRVQNLSCEGLGIGSGFLIDGQTLVTNRHVVAGARKLAVTTWNGQRLEVEADEEATFADLALIRLAPAELPKAELSGADPAVGAPIQVVGYPGGGKISATAGEVTDYVAGPRRGNTGEVIEISARVKPGNSGGPVIDASGDVVGVVYAVDALSGQGLAVPISTLKAVLDEGTHRRTPALC